MLLLSAAILRLQLIALATIVSSLPTSSVASRQGGSALVNTGGQRRDDSLLCVRIRGGGACFPCTGVAALRESVPDPQKSTVEHEFVVFFEEQGKADNYAPALVGSWQGWNISSAIPMYRDAGHVRWSALVTFPIKNLIGNASGVEYKYILVRTPATFPSQTPESPTLDYQEFLWESGPNRYVNLTGPSTIPIFSSDHDQVAELRPEGQGGKGVAAAPSSEPPLAAAGNENQGQGDQGEHLRHQLNAAPSCTDVRFEARYSPKSASEFVAVVGSSRVLGRWVPADALRLIRVSSDSTRWRASLAIPFPRTVEWKFIILDSNDFDRVLWEGGPNRRCVLSDDGAVTKYPDTLQLQELTDHSPPPETLIRSTSNDDLNRGAKKAGSSIGRLESFQRVLGALHPRQIGAIKNKLLNQIK